MQKISPLRSSIEAFNKFKALRSNKTNKTNKTNDVNSTQKSQTNPFGITFKGTVIQMDVFENSNKTEKTNTSKPLKEQFQDVGKLVASAWVGTINKFSSLKTNAIAFGNKLKDTTVATAKKIQKFGNTKVEFDVFKYNVSRLQNQPVSDLRTMLSNELQGVSYE